MTAEMIAFLLLLLMAMLRLLSVVLNKKFQQSISVDPPHLIMFSMVSSAFACLYFAILSGFQIDINFKTLIYAIVYGLLIIVSSATRLLSLRYSSVSLTTVSEMSGSILLPTVFGIWYFSEPVDWKLIVSAILVLLSVILPHLKEEMSGSGLITVINCALLVLSAGGSVILVKLYSQSDGVCNSQSLFFLCNVVIVAVCLLYAVFLAITKGISCLKSMIPSVPQVANIATNTLIGNAMSILSIIVLATMQVSTYTMVNSGLTLIGAFFISLLIFREKQNTESRIAVVCAILAVIIKQI